MKIFSQNTPERVASPVNDKKGKKSLAPLKKSLSENEIREKLAANSEISDSAKLKAKKETQKLGDGFMTDDDHLLKSDVQLNKPDDPVTAEKLKSVLDKGAFNFNPKEREVLEKILSK
jgi:hypothetical protein